MSGSSNPIKRLSELKAGQTGHIVALKDDEEFLRLMEMGFIVGEKVKVLHLAPLGDPMMIHVFGYQVSLRKNEAERILVECIETNS